MKRLVIFAHYDKHNVVDLYVISYLRELKKYVDDIIFVSDGDLPEVEKDKVKDLCCNIISQRHSQYDFGSYRRGLELLSKQYPEKLKEIDELLFVNDSCYLVGSLEETFTGTSKEDCDCWGIVDDYHSFNNDSKYYIGSFFIAFRKEVFQKKFFIDFMEETKKFHSREEMINRCEFGLSELLLKENKRLFAYFNMNKTARYIADNHIKIAEDVHDLVKKNSYLGSRKILLSIVNNLCNVHTYNYLHTNKFYILLRMNFPLLKRRNLQYKSFTRQRLMFLWEEVLLATNSERVSTIDQIKNHCLRIGLKMKSKKIISSKFNYFLYLLSITRWFYIKKFKKNGRNFTTFKIIFFKIKISKKIQE